MIMEIMGRPPAHIIDTMKMITDKMGQEKGINIKNIKIHEPMPLKETKDLFTTFAEIEAEFDSVANYLGIIFAYLPSNIEIMSPQKINLTNDSLNLLGNNLISRMHSYDAIAKKMLADNNNLLKEIAVLKSLKAPAKAEAKNQIKTKKKKKTKK